jgi:chromosome segregation ATPase
MTTTEQHNLRTREANQARQRMLRAMRELEKALAQPSYERRKVWRENVSRVLEQLQVVLRETRETADQEDSLLTVLAAEFPRLQPRCESLRGEYDAIQERIKELREQIADREPCSSDIAGIRQKLADLLTAIRHVQAEETELIYEAYQVDIGGGD